ncbi:MAG: LLM class flavin-dependent oxidoreductase [Acidimicrobiia bacterium]|nr:LLM class flavin-dependent oxidoreductase [Acidimicrobiia bacterium]
MELALQTSGNYETVKLAARWSESAGLGAIALPDHYLMSTVEEARPAYDALIQFAGLARETETIELVVLVSPITFRHPSVYVKTAVTLADMSGGRFKLGLGTGWMDAEHEVFGIPYPERAERFEHLEEALAYCQAAFDPTNPGYTGDRYQLKSFDVQPMTPVPLLVGGFGPHKTPRLAGLYCEEFNVYSGPIDDMRIRIERAREAAVGAGRSDDGLFISTACPPIVGQTEKAYRAALEDAVPIMGKETADDLHDLLERRGFPHGTPDQVADILGQMEEIGVERWYVQARLETVSEETLDGLFTCLR